MLLPPTRGAVGVGCDACGVVALVYLTVHPRPSCPRELRLQVVPDPDDLVLLQLFQEAHRGPFSRRP